VRDGDYKTHPGRTIPFLIFYTAQWTWQAMVPCLFGTCLFGAKSFEWYEKVVGAAVFLGVSILTATGTTIKHWAINKPTLQLFVPSASLPSKAAFPCCWCPCLSATCLEPARTPPPVPSYVHDRSMCP